MQKITYETALRALNEAVKAKGYNHTYQRSGTYGCYNVTLGGDPDCIVGWALIWLGVPAQWFLERDKEHGDARRGAGAGSVCNMLYRSELLDVDEDAVDLFNSAQARQDQGVTWGEAVTIGHLGGEAFDNLRLNENAPLSEQ